MSLAVRALSAGPRHRMPARRAYPAMALVFLVAMSFTTIPTPLYPLYERTDGFTPVVVTVVFAAYAVGVIVALILVGHLGDTVGRRPLIAAAIGFELVAAALFVSSEAVGVLIVARVVSGFGVGAITATATAYLGELAEARPDSRGSSQAATTLANAVNVGGLGLGPLIGSLLAVATAAPLSVPYAVYAVAFAVLAGLLWFLPETVDAPRRLPRYRPQRLVVPSDARGAFVMASAAAFGAFSVFGLFSAVAPGLIRDVFGVRSPVGEGAIVLSVFVAAALAQLVLARLSPARQTTVGVAALVAGLALIAIGAASALLAVFVVGGVVAGAGVGLMFRTAIGATRALVDPGSRGEIFATTFLVAYAGLTLPVVAVGALLAVVPRIPLLAGFCVVVGALVVVTGIRMARSLAER